MEIDISGSAFAAEKATGEDGHCQMIDLGQTTKRQRIRRKHFLSMAFGCGGPNPSNFHVEVEAQGECRSLGVEQNKFDSFLWIVFRSWLKGIFFYFFFVFLKA